MRGFRVLSFLVFFACAVYSCSNQPNGTGQRTNVDKPVVNREQGAISRKGKSLVQLLPPGYLTKAAYYFKKYTKDSSGLGEFLSNGIYEDRSGIKPVGCFRLNGIPDSIFVLPPLCAADTGQSYYFSDTTIPRLRTKFCCCDPEFIFLTGDIDEDGISEIGQLEFSCNGRSQSLAVWSVRHGNWRKVGECSYDMNIETPAMKTRVKKTGRGSFEMLDVTLVEETKPNAHGELMTERRVWKRFHF